jgi:general secretion pathway protein D
MALVLALSGCVNEPMAVPTHLPPVVSESQDTELDLTSEERPDINATRKLPALRIADWQEDAESKWEKLGVTEKSTDLNVESMPLNRFVQVALGDVLGLSFIVDPAVQSRNELVTLRISKPMPAKMLLDTVEQVLAGYEVGLSTAGGTLEVLPAAKLANLAPTFVGSRARIAMQRGKVMMIIPLKYSNTDEAMKFARHFLNIGPGTSINTIRRLNALVVVGDSAKVQRFRSVVEMVDQPSMAGRTVQIFRPVYWQAEEILSLLAEALKTQGVLVAERPESPGVYLSEVKQLNSLIVAAPDNTVMSWIDQWIQALDTPDVAGDTLRSFVYPVKHSTAEELGGLVAEVLGGFGSGGGSGGDSDGGRNAGNDSGTAAVSSSNIKSADGSGLRMVIDEPHNSLVFVGSAQSFKAVYQMLQQVDVPAKQVLLEVTVADITLEANVQLGIEWRFTSSKGDLDGAGGTFGGLGVGGGGFSYTAFDDVGDIRARINALATSGDAQILSSPKLLAVDNEEARIQVGTQISVVTSENTSSSVDGIIRSFTYIDTGVILSFTPTVMAGDQVRLYVSQEVSVPGSSLNNTPPINTRSVQTTLIARSGSTVMIGGLISSTETVSEQKVPFFGNLPGIGALFRSRDVVDNSTEMIVLITPHIIESSSQLEALTEAFRDQIDW